LKASKTCKLISIILVSSILALCLSACGTSNETEVTDYSNSTVTGKVTAIDGNSVTLILGELTESNPKGNAPPSDGEPSSGVPSGDGPSSEVPSGDRPSGDAPAMMTFIASEDTITVTIGDTATIMIEEMGKKTEGKIDDIAVDDILEITFGDSKTVTEVLIKDISRARNGENPSGDFGDSGEVSNESN